MKAPAVVPTQLTAQSDQTSTAQAHAEPAPGPAIVETGARRDPLRWEGNAADGSHLWRMPSLVGLTGREALRAMQGQPFEIEITGQGVVRSQHPEAGASVAERSQIRLTLGSP